MNLDELRSVQAKERRKDSLQHLRDSFYDDVAAYLVDLRAARDRRAAQVENPFSDDDVRRMSDEIETGEEVAEAIYERRVGKVVKLASFAAADMSVDVEGLTAEERRLFEDLVERIGRNKSTVLDVLTGVTADATVEPSMSSDPEMVEAAPDIDDTSDATAESTAEDTTDATAESTAENTTDATAEDTTDTDTGTHRSTGNDPMDTKPDRQSTEKSAADRDLGGRSDPLTDAMGSTDSDPPVIGEESIVESDGLATDHTDSDEMGLDVDRDPDQSDSETAMPTEPEPAPPGAMGLERDTAGVVDAATESIQRTTVRITTDVGAILGVDEREYDLSAEDVVTLPEANAAPLIERDAAERID